MSLLLVVICCVSVVFWIFPASRSRQKAPPPHPPAQCAGKLANEWVDFVKQKGSSIDSSVFAKLRFFLFDIAQESAFW
jgi:hypothetical protein